MTVPYLIDKTVGTILYKITDDTFMVEIPGVSGMLRRNRWVLNGKMMVPISKEEYEIFAILQS